MMYRPSLSYFVQNYLPPGAEIINTRESPGAKGIQMWDFDGDGNKEIVVSYLWFDNPHVLILKKINNMWYKVFDIKGKGYGFNYLAGLDVTGNGTKDLIIGWQVDSIWSELNVFTCVNNKVRRIIKDRSYSKIEDVIKSIEEELNLKVDNPSMEKFVGLREKIEPKKTIIQRLESKTVDLYPASISTLKGEKWGFINNKGEVKIDFVYDMVYGFQDNGLAIVKAGELCGIIDMSGKYVVEPKYIYIQEFSEGVAAASDEKGYMLIDEKGNIISSKRHNYIGIFHEGRAQFSDIVAENKTLYGYIDNYGNEIIPAKYEYALDFKNNKAVSKVDGGGYVILDKNGNVLVTLPYEYVGDIGDGLLAYKEKDDGKYGYIDEFGNVILLPKYSSADMFKDERAVVNVTEDFLNNKYGLIDKKGNFVIQPKYNNIELLGEGMVRVGIPLKLGNSFMGSKYSIADISGKFYTDFIYYGVSSYDNSLGSAYDSSKTFFVDKKGKRVNNLPIVNGSGVLTLESDDLIKGDIDNRIRYLDKNGKTIWKQSKAIDLNNKYSIKEEKYKPNKDYLVYYPQIKGMKNKRNQDKANKILKRKSEVKNIDNREQLDYSYYGDFAAIYFKKNLVVIKLSGYNYPFGAAHGMPNETYVHVDLISGRVYELKDLFKKDSNYVKVLSDIIKQQIDKLGPDSGIWVDQYKGIKENQPFYITEETLNIYFTPYEIAPYAYGFPTFKIPFNEIMNIIDTEGVFWQSFNK